VPNANVSGASTGSNFEESIRKLGTNTDGVKSIVMSQKPVLKAGNLEMVGNKRRWENQKRSALISADASRLYQTSTKINSQIDKRLN